MNNQHSFTYESLQKMQYNSTWRNSIKFDDSNANFNKNKPMKLHAQWDWGAGGRQYIALPADVDVTNRSVRKKYNLM